MNCKQPMAHYYCNICHLFDDEPGRQIYHCPFCNLCRLGQGLGADACHCMRCNCCMHLSVFKGHKCRDVSTCPVCTEYLFNSSQPYRVSHTWLDLGSFSIHKHSMRISCCNWYARFNLKDVC